MESTLTAINNHPWTFFWLVVSIIVIVEAIGQAFKKDSE